MGLDSYGLESKLRHLLGPRDASFRAVSRPMIPTVVHSLDFAGSSSTTIYCTKSRMKSQYLEATKCSQNFGTVKATSENFPKLFETLIGRHRTKTSSTLPSAHNLHCLCGQLLGYSLRATFSEQAAHLPQKKVGSTNLFLLSPLRAKNARRHGGRGQKSPWGSGVICPKLKSLR